MTPTARALADCRKFGWLAHVVERWLPQARRRVDAFGFGDVLVVEPGVVGALLVQVTTDAHASERVHKIRDACADAAQTWLDAGNRIEVWGYAKRGPAGKAKRWRLRRIEVGFTQGELTTRELATAQEAA